MTKLSNQDLKEVIKLLEAGAKIKDIAPHYNITQSRLSIRIREETGKSITQIRRESLKEEVVKSLKAGAKIKDVAASYGSLIPYYLSQIIKKETGKSITQIRHESLKEDLKRVREGKTHLFQVRTKFGYKPTGFNKLLKELGDHSLVYEEKPIRGIEILALKESLATGGNPEIDALIEQGLPKLTIARKTGYGEDRQYIDQYIEGSGQWRYWTQKKSERFEKLERLKTERKLKSPRYRLVNLISKHLQEVSQIQGSDNIEAKVEKTIFRLKKNSRFNFDKARKLFTAYFTAQQEKRRVSLTYLGREAGYSDEVSALYFMKRAGLYERRYKTQEQARLMNEVKWT